MSKEVVFSQSHARRMGNVGLRTKLANIRIGPIRRMTILRLPRRLPWEAWSTERQRRYGLIQIRLAMPTCGLRRFTELMTSGTCSTLAATLPCRVATAVKLEFSKVAMQPDHPTASTPTSRILFPPRDHRVARTKTLPLALTGHTWKFQGRVVSTS